MLISPLELMQGLDPAKPWRVDLRRTKTGDRIWRLFFGAETAPRLILREPR